MITKDVSIGKMEEFELDWGLEEHGEEEVFNSHRLKGVGLS
jgi:hypothetical protein